MNHYLNATEILSGVFSSADVSLDSFSRKNYKNNFERTYQSLVPAFDSIEALYKSVGEPEQMLANMAQVITGQALARVEECPRKNAKETAKMNLNMQRAVFIFPAILQYHGESSGPLTDALGKAWKEAFPKSNVSAATYETIEKGFHRKFCYITTAVCENTGRGDDCYEMTLLRDYRDNYLARQENGARMITAYYDVAPSIVKHINRREDAEQIYEGIWENHIRPCIELIEQGEKEACALRYSQMVSQLREEFFFQ